MHSTVPPCLHSDQKHLIRCASRAKTLSEFSSLKWRTTPLLGCLAHILPSCLLNPYCAARVLCNGRSRPGLHIGGQLQGGSRSGSGKHRLQPMAASLCCVLRTASFSKPFSEWIQYSTEHLNCQGAELLNFPHEIPAFPTFCRFSHGVSAGSSGSGRRGTGWQTPPPSPSAWRPSPPPAGTAVRTAEPPPETRRHRCA